MFIQGDLQVIFDALYEVGAIDPVLKLDWQEVTSQMSRQQKQVNRIFDQINDCHGNKSLLVQKLQQMDETSRSYVAMEVAREYAEFQDRKDLH